MDYTNSGDSVECGLGVGDGGGRCTSTPHRRPLQQLNQPLAASPRPQTSLTPYKYHKCQVIPEEVDQENVDPRLRRLPPPKDSHSSSKSHMTSSLEGSVPQEESSPFAYPLIWESTTFSTSGSPRSPHKPARPPPIESTCLESPISHHPSTSSSQGSYRARSKSAEECQLRSKCRERAGAGEKARNRSGSCSEASSHGKTNHHHHTITPSKQPSTQADRSVFVTPSDRYTSLTRSGGENHGGGGGLTPNRQLSQQQHSINPFEVGADSLHLPTVSPSLFRQVVSPSQVETNFRWSIDQLAVLQPANIETSPFNQVDVFTDPDYERQAQDAIDKFFSHQSVVPSPWTGSNKSVNLLKLSSTPALPCSQATPSCQTVWCQTELTLPPTLPQAVQEALRPYFNFTQDQWWQGSTEGEENANISNTTLRRKLLFSTEELLNATPMCSPRGTEVSEGGSPPSSPGAPLPLHEDSPPRVEEDEEQGLVWSTEVIGPSSLVKESVEVHLSRCPPITPPSLPLLVTPQSGVSYVASTSSSLPPAPSSPQQHHSPAVSPIAADSQEGEGMDVLQGSLSSPKVSPIHLQFGSDQQEVGEARAEVTPETRQGHPNLPRVASFISPLQPSVVPAAKSRKCSPGGRQAQEVVCGQDAPPSVTTLPERKSKVREEEEKTEGYHQSGMQEMGDVSMTGVERDSIMREERQTPAIASPTYSTTCSSPNPLPKDSPSTLDRRKNASLNRSSNISDLRNASLSGYGTASHSSSSSITRHSSSRLSSLHFSTLEGLLSDEAEEVEMPQQGSESDRSDRSQKPLDVSKGFAATEPQQQGSQPDNTLLVDHKSSSNSGHFSSSPIRNSSCSVEERSTTPSHRFSASPPLSPILCRSLMVQPPPHTVAQHMVVQGDQAKAEPLDFTQSMVFSDNPQAEKMCNTAEMMEDGPCRQPSDCPPPRPSTLLLRSSSVLDMETDSQPFLELMGSEEGMSQDTGYHTGSLHSTNFSSTSTSHHDLTSATTHHKESTLSTSGRPVRTNNFHIA